MWSPDSITDATTLLLAITNTEFISALVITHKCLQYLRGLTVSLQEEAKDIVQAVSEIKTLTSSLKEVRENVDSYHSKWFETISAICSEVGTVPAMPRICSRQRRAHQQSILLSTTKEQSQFLAELDRRFTSHQKTALQGQYLVPSNT